MSRYRLQDKGILRAAFLKDEKLQLLIGGGILVMRAWPPQAWFRQSPTSPWRHCRPVEYDLSGAYAENRFRAERVECELAAPGIYAKWLEDPGLIDREGIAAPLNDPPESIGAILARMAKNNFVASSPDLTNLQRSPVLVELFRRLQRVSSERATYEAFLRGVPSTVRSAIAPFPERHFSLASLCARCPGGLDLVHSTPALAMMLANCWVFGKRVKRPLRSARALIRKPQRDQLGWLNVTAPGKSVLSILRKVPTTCCRVELLLYLRDALADARARKMLSHLPRINRGVVRIVSDPELLTRVTYNFLAELGEMSDEDTRAELGRQLIEVLGEWGDDLPRRRFKSVHEFNQLYADTIDIGSRVSFAELRSLEFPDPPLAGTAEIKPITSSLGLLAEGREQRHCIASYAKHIAKGNGYAYRVRTGNDKATLFIRPGSSNESAWQIAECRGTANAPVPTHVLASICQWIEGDAVHPAKPDAIGQMLLPLADSVDKNEP